MPPEPTPTDPYPGYYILPSGSWAAYDPTYYQKFYKKWKKEYDNHVRALEKGIEKGFEGMETDGATEVNALSEMEKAKVEIQEREERKALTMAGDEVPVAPKMNIKVCRWRWLSACAFLSTHVWGLLVRAQRWVDEPRRGISCPRSSRRRIRTGRPWKSKLRKHGGIAKRLATSMVRGSSLCVETCSSHLCQASEVLRSMLSRFRVELVVYYHMLPNFHSLHNVPL